MNNNILSTDYRNTECNGTRHDLSLFDRLFDLLTWTMESGLNKKYENLTFDEALGLYNNISGAAREFLYLLLIQGVNNVSEVSEFTSSVSLLVHLWYYASSLFLIYFM